MEEQTTGGGGGAAIIENGPKLPFVHPARGRSGIPFPFLVFPSFCENPTKIDGVVNIPELPT